VRGATTGHTNLEEAVVEGGEHGREGGPHPAPPGGPVQALRRGGPQLVARALQRTRPVRALGRGGRDHGGAPPQRARQRRRGAARAGVRDRRHVRRQRGGGRALPAPLLGWPVDRSCGRGTGAREGGRSA